MAPLLELKDIVLASQDYVVLDRASVSLRQGGQQRDHGTLRLREEHPAEGGRGDLRAGLRRSAAGGPEPAAPERGAAAGVAALQRLHVPGRGPLGQQDHLREPGPAAPVPPPGARGRRGPRRGSGPAWRAVGLEASAELRPAQLSMGETKIVSFLRAVILEPELLFLDEPTPSIDHAALEKMMAMIREMKQRGCTIISRDPRRPPGLHAGQRPGRAQAGPGAGGRGLRHRPAQPRPAGRRNPFPGA